MQLTEQERGYIDHLFPRLHSEADKKKSGGSSSNSTSDSMISSRVVSRTAQRVANTMVADSARLASECSMSR